MIKSIIINMEENKNAETQVKILMADHSDDSGDEIVDRND